MINSRHQVLYSFIDERNSTLHDDSVKDHGKCKSKRFRI